MQFLLLIKDSNLAFPMPKLAPRHGPIFWPFSRCFGLKYRPKWSLTSLDCLTRRTRRWKMMTFQLHWSISCRKYCQIIADRDKCQIGIDREVDVNQTNIDFLKWQKTPWIISQSLENKLTSSSTKRSNNQGKESQIKWYTTGKIGHRIWLFQLIQLVGNHH